MGGFGGSGGGGRAFFVSMSGRDEWISKRPFWQVFVSGRLVCMCGGGVSND